MFISGMGLAPKIGYAISSTWIIVKLGCWPVLMALSGIAFRRPGAVKTLGLVALALLSTGVVMVYQKPGTKVREVKAPALFAFREEMPLSRTLAMAEGFTADADRSRIHVVRGSLSNPTLIVTDFNKIITGQAQDVQLEPGDIVFVPTTGLATWARMLNQIVPTIQALQTGIILQQGISSSKG
jgi:hypothetical protein